MAHPRLGENRDFLAAIPNAAVDGHRIADGDRIHQHIYRHPAWNLFRRRCTCGRGLCLAADEQRTERRMR